MDDRIEDIYNMDDRIEDIIYQKQDRGSAPVEANDTGNASNGDNGGKLKEVPGN